MARQRRKDHRQDAKNAKDTKLPQPLGDLGVLAVNCCACGAP